MKNLYFLMSAFLLLTMMASCGSSKTAGNVSPVATFVQPCSEYMVKDSVLRAWAIGKSDSENTARKKAQTLASAQLAAQLEKTVRSTIEDYSTMLSEGEVGTSKALLVTKTTIAVSKTLKGARTICDKWSKDEATGQYSNYIVMELDAETYMKNLKNELTSETTQFNYDLLQQIFMKHTQNAQ